MGTGPTATPTTVPNTPTPTTTGGQTPYGGTARAIGTIQGRSFDNGGEAVAYHDLDTANNGEEQYRTTGVDVETTSDTGGGYDVGWMRTGEWIEYTVNVGTAGAYTLAARGLGREHRQLPRGVQRCRQNWHRRGCSAPAAGRRGRRAARSA